MSQNREKLLAHDLLGHVDGRQPEQKKQAVAVRL
jgi:hypothetical protein